MAYPQNEPGSLYRLIYVSHIAPARAGDIDRIMREVLAVSHRLNGRDGVTGMLLSNGVWFVQALEGEESLVEDCYDRIAVDARHVLPTVRSREGARARLFERWSMCGLTLSDLDDQLLCAPVTPFDIWTQPGGALLQMLKSVADRFGPALDQQHAGLVAGARPSA